MNQIQDHELEDYGRGARRNIPIQALQPSPRRTHNRMVIAAVFWLFLAPASPSRQVRRLNAGDSLAIVCPESAALCLQTSVSAKGDLQLRGLPPIDVANLTLNEAADKLGEAIEESGLAADPHVRILITTGRKKTETIRGNVVQPGEYSSAVLQDLLNQAQPKAGSDLKHVKVLAVDGQTFTVDSTGAEWRVRPGDQVQVEAAKGQRDVYILGGVERPSVLEYEEGMTVAEAVTRAGGVSGYGSVKAWRWIHENKQEENLDPTPAAAAKLQPGDTVEVPYQSTPPMVVVIGAVNQPVGVPYKSGLRLQEALKEAGGPSPEADKNRILIRDGVHHQWRTVDPGVEKRSGSKNRAGEANPILQPGDAVIVLRIQVQGPA